MRISPGNAIVTMRADFEQARNVSQLTGTRVTILDPRYTPSGGPKKLTLYDQSTIHMKTQVRSSITKFRHTNTWIATLQLPQI